MKRWKVLAKEKEYLELIISMTTDCLMGKGTDSRSAYTSNLRMIANCIDAISGEEPKEK